MCPREIKMTGTIFLFLLRGYLLCVADVLAADLKGSPDELDRQDFPNMAVSEGTGLVILPSNEAVTSSVEEPPQNGLNLDGRQSDNGMGEGMHSADQTKQSPLPSKASPDANLSIWELLRFTLPTLGVWIINPILR
jgi:hypothetical protein